MGNEDSKLVAARQLSERGVNTSGRSNPSTLNVETNPSSDSRELSAQTTISSLEDADASNQSRSVSSEAMERKTFLLFVKILFKILKDTQAPAIAQRAQRVVMECRRRSQQGDKKSIPLMDALERRLRIFVGEAIWRRAHLYLHHYMSTRQGQLIAPSSIVSV